MTDAQPEYPGIPYYIPEFRLHKYAVLIERLIKELILDNEAISNDQVLETKDFIPIAANLIKYIDHDPNCNGSSCRHAGFLAD